MAPIITVAVLASAAVECGGDGDDTPGAGGTGASDASADAGGTGAGGSAGGGAAGSDGSVGDGSSGAPSDAVTADAEADASPPDAQPDVEQCGTLHATCTQQIDCCGTLVCQTDKSTGEKACCVGNLQSCNTDDQCCQGICLFQGGPIGKCCYTSSSTCL
jgi:hypothetical protein